MNRLPKLQLKLLMVWWLIDQVKRICRGNFSDKQETLYILVYTVIPLSYQGGMGNSELSVSFSVASSASAVIGPTAPETLIL
jgi:hypothetical protein